MLALEASRLARNNRAWHHLIDLCAMAGTLVIDHGGVYDTSLLNDRLLLGLKGTMSEFEISLLRQRAMEAHHQRVQRGCVMTQVPVGYIRTENEGIEKTSDRQVQEAIAGVFRKFRELGSVRQVLLWYREEKLMLPTLSRESGNRKVVWIGPIYQRLFGILGRTQSQTDEKRRALELALEKARYEARRMERQYQATEPENRLVAAELEKRWNNALAYVAEKERRLEEAAVTAPQLSSKEREQLLRLGDDLKQLWDHPNSPVTLKKRILRTVLLGWRLPYGADRSQKQDRPPQPRQFRRGNGADS